MVEEKSRRGDICSRFMFSASQGFIDFQECLLEFPEMTLSPPLNITPQTFSFVTDFCYGAHLAVTPFNVASLLTAAELLHMTDGQQSLKQLTEAYFLRVVSVIRECALLSYGLKRGAMVLALKSKGVVQIEVTKIFST